jgi:hypothetical protein
MRISNHSLPRRHNQHYTHRHPPDEPLEPWRFLLRFRFRHDNVGKGLPRNGEHVLGALDEPADFTHALGHWAAHLRGELGGDFVLGFAEFILLRV